MNPLPLLPLIDTFGRSHNNLRISVTDRCNIRCFYCMPAENVQFMDRKELLYMRRSSGSCGSPCPWGSSSCD